MSASSERGFAGELVRSNLFLAGACIILFWLICAVCGTQIAPHDPFGGDPLDALLPPSPDYWFGTDQLGRDIFSRVIAGARDIFIIAPAATLLGIVSGTVLGLVTGYFRGIVDDALSRVIDAVLALPLVIIALMALVALGTSNITVIVVIGFAFMPNVARTVRSAVLSESALDYVAAARLRNESGLHILFVEILPNVLSPVFVETTVRLGYAIFTVATLSFIGFGVQPPSADWGLSIAENYSLIPGGFWWTVLFDALAIVSLVVGVNLVAEGARGALEA